MRKIWPWVTYRTCGQDYQQTGTTNITATGTSTTSRERGGRWVLWFGKMKNWVWPDTLPPKESSVPEPTIVSRTIGGTWGFEIQPTLKTVFGLI